MMNVMQSDMINGAVDFQKKKMGDEKAALQTGLLVPSIKMEQGSKPTSTTANSTPALLLELVTIVTQIAQLDKMFDQIKENAPEAGSEADKWHKVSVQALETSRKYMVEQQMSLIQRLANVTGTQFPVQSGDVALHSSKDEAPSAKTIIAPPPGLEAMHMDEQAVINNPQSGSPKAADVSVEGSSLRTDLEKIKQYEPGCALLVRKIKAFGFESADYLETHFQQIGEVAEVLVSHCITKPSAKRANGRVRPAALGIVIMATPEDAAKVSAHGDHQLIPFKESSVCVEVSHFQDVSEASE